MKKIFKTQTQKRRLAAGLGIAFAATFSLGMLAACASNSESGKQDKTPVSPADTQTLKNGNFEFYSDNNLEDVVKKVNVINSPNSWSFTSGSPSSDASSGIINTADWAYYARTGGYPFQSFTKGEGEDAEEISTFRTIEEAVANWDNDNVSAYDRIKFLFYFKDEIKALADGTEAKTTLDKYKYTVDFDDVKKLDEDLPQGVTLRSNVASGETSVLMIHNDRTSDNVRGTAQYYTSSTTINLQAGTSAEVSVWVRTDHLFHYKDTELTGRGGAYIGVINTVGGSTLDQMQIYNINTEGEWVNYSIYVRASTFASSSFRIVLGLGQGSSDDRYYAVDGYAFFDDVSCKIIPDSSFENAVFENGTLQPKADVRLCTVDSLKDDKRFAVDNPDLAPVKTFALDLDASIESDIGLLSHDPEFKLTEEKSGSKTYTSESIDPSLAKSQDDFTKVATVKELSESENVYVKNVYENDIKDKFPFGGEDTKVLMLLSSNGAAYTAKITSSLFTLKKDTRLLVSFYVKTNKISSGLTGAGATIVDGETKTAISAVDTTVLSSVDIDPKGDESEKDIFKGWTQCFFFLENDTDEDITFSLELSFGPTTIIGTNKFSYGDGYAAFTNFETKQLNKTEYGYATTGDRAKKVSLTGGIEESKKFDSVSVTDEKTLENSPALPANFRGVLGGCDFVQKNEEKTPNKTPAQANVTAGLVNSKYAQNYLDKNDEWARLLGAAEGKEASAWWREAFGNARQPLVIVNHTSDVSYGFFSETATVSSSSYQRIAVRVKASQGAVAYVYLTETDASKIGESLSPNLPGVTYWYDDDGNIYRKKDAESADPTEDNFDELMTMAYELAENGLYTQVNGSSDTYFANLHNFDKDEDGNLIAKSGEIVFYAGEGGTFYAYRDEESGALSTPVNNLPTDIARYNYTERNVPSAQIKIEGTGDWVNVNFYVHTESEEKDYRLEVWNGSRDGTETNPANTYVIFDNYISENASSDYSAALNESVQALKDVLNTGKNVTDADYLGDEDNLPSDYANYYTFTFYDSLSYVRYDETKDEQKTGNPWASYEQSAQTEQLVTLTYVDHTQGNTRSYNFFLDLGAIDVSVTPDDLSDDDGDDTDSSTDNTPTGETNIWLLISSGILAVVLLAVILLIIIRRLWSKRSKKVHVKPAKDERGKKNKKANR